MNDLLVAKATIQSIKEKQTKQAKCMAELILWGEVKNQGIDPNQVRAFGYSEKLLTPAQKKVFYMFATKWLPDPITGKRERELGYNPDHPYMGTKLPNGHYKARVYNYVTFKDGSGKALCPMLKAPE